MKTMRTISGLLLLVLASSQVSAGNATNTNACFNEVTGTYVSRDITMAGSDSPDPLTVGSPITLSGTSVSATFDANVFLAGYRLFLLNSGSNSIPATLTATILASNTTQLGTTKVLATSVTVTIVDPTPANRSSGDESALPLNLSRALSNSTWTPTGGDVLFTQEVFQLETVIGGFLPVMLGPCFPATQLTGCDAAGNCTGFTPDPSPEPFETTSDPSAPGGCPTAPDAGCQSTGKGSLLAGPGKVIAKFLTGPQLTQTDFGNPLDAGGTAYSLCIYDDMGGSAGSLSVARAGETTCNGKPCWRAVGNEPPDGTGYKYVDPELSAADVKKIVLKGGAAGKSKALVKAFPATPTGGISAALAGSTGATIQLHGSDAPVCLTATLGDVRTNDGTTFKAKVSEDGVLAR